MRTSRTNGRTDTTRSNTNLFQIDLWSKAVISMRHVLVCKVIYTICSKMAEGIKRAQLIEYQTEDYFTKHRKMFFLRSTLQSFWILYFYMFIVLTSMYDITRLIAIKRALIRSLKSHHHFLTSISGICNLRH